MSTYAERHAEALEELREHLNCIGCRLGICNLSHDDDEDDES